MKEQAENQLKRRLTLFGLTMIAVGSCIGSGIFVTPGKIAALLPHAGWILLVWVVGGVIALTGALTFAELGGLFPRAGGVYVFLKEAYGELTGFLYGWAILLVINTGALAALGLAFAEYMTFFFEGGLSDWDKSLIGMGTIALLTVCNIFGVHVSQWISNFFTGLKLLAILLIGVIGFTNAQPHTELLTYNLSEAAPDNLLSVLLLALVGVLFSFGGWHHASYLAAETRRADYTVPRAMIFGTGIVTLMYVLINLAYLYLLPIDQIAQGDRVAGMAVGQVIQNGGQLVAVAIALSIFGTISIYTMTAPRIYFAMANDGVFFAQLARVHPRFRTPVNAMLLQAIWAIILILAWGTFHNLITYVTFMDIAFMTLGGISLFIFRRKRPDAVRPYRTLGYPLVPAIFILISGAFVVNTLIFEPVQTGSALGVLASGVIFYLLFRRR